MKAAANLLGARSLASLLPSPICCREEEEGNQWRLLCSALLSRRQMTPSACWRSGEVDSGEHEPAGGREGEEKPAKNRCPGQGDNFPTYFFLRLKNIENENAVHAHHRRLSTSTAVYASLEGKPLG